MRLDPEAVHRRIAELLQERRRFVVASIVDVKGSCPQRPGARMIVHPDGGFEFTIGGGTFEAEVLHDAAALLAGDRQAAGSSSSGGLREYRLTKNELGMYCQGVVQVFLETYDPRPRLLIFGGGHVGQALSRLAGSTGLFSVTVIDDRAEYADAARHPLADRVIHTDRAFEAEVPETDSQTYLVIVTRCHATDKLIVKRYIERPFLYIGVIGSQSKAAQFRRELAEEGISKTALEKLHSPIGLPIGGKDPAEVAVSILAELVQTKNSAMTHRQDAEKG